MTTLPTKSISQMIVSSISYNNEIPDEWFTPQKLHMLSEAENPVAKAAKKGSR